MPTIEESTRDFLAALDDIDFQFITFFISREPANKEDVRDRLTNHCIFKIDQGKAYFGFIDGSDMPYNIRKKCFAKFIHFFPEGNITGSLFKG